MLPGGTYFVPGGLVPVGVVGVVGIVFAVFVVAGLVVGVGVVGGFSV